MAKVLKLHRYDHEQPDNKKLQCQVDSAEIAALEDCGDFRMLTLKGQKAAVRVHETVDEIEAMKGK